MDTGNAQIQIAVLSGGFVYVGRCHYNGVMLVVTDAYNIRRWGTARGLGQLVSGPTDNTELDHVGVVRAPTGSVLHLIDAQEGAWTAHLK